MFVARLYTLVAAVAIFTVAWAAVVARPWPDRNPPKPDPRVTALASREKSLRRETKDVERVVKRRWTLYERRLKVRQGEIAAARQQYEERLAAARNAAARIVAQRAAVLAAASRSAPVAVQTAAVQSPVAAAAAPQPVRVVTLPPVVQVVELPPITKSKSS